MNRLLTLLITALLALGLSASANVWQYQDFGSPLDGENNTTPIPFSWGLPSPGLYNEGGEQYDLEGMHIAADNDYLYVSLANSFGSSSYSPTYNRSFWQGDIFFGTGGYTDNQFAINMEQYVTDLNVGNTVLSRVGDWGGIDIGLGTWSGTWVENFVGAYKVTQSIEDFSIEHAMTVWEGYEDVPFFGDPYQDVFVHEFKIRLVYLNLAAGQTLYFHTTLGCGNDLIRKEFCVPGIPEPSTLILLGLGLTGAGLLVRRK